MTIINSIMASTRTVFTMQSLLMLLDGSQTADLPAKMHYYVKQGGLLNPRRGIYAKSGYDLRLLYNSRNSFPGRLCQNYPYVKIDIC